MNGLRKTLGCLLLLLLAAVTSVYAQSTKVYSGTVADADSNDPIIGVNITLKGTSTGTITDASGKFSINAPIGSTLELSYIGYVTKEIRLDGNSVLNIVMKEDQQLLSEVVVIGYGTMKKSDITGAIASVSSKQFKDQPVKRMSDILQGRTSGVAVTNMDGLPGGGVKIRVRGTTSINKSSDPLYVIDGVVAGGLDVNPVDIQSIEVLKDASATAIYGSRGANGVVLVTTKKGAEGKVQIFASVDIGVSNIVKKYDLLNAYDYANALNDYKGSGTISPEDLEAYKNGTKGIDWQNKMLQTGISQDYKLGVSGGSAKNKYYISANVLDMTAMTITTKYQRAQLRINLDNELTKWLTLSTKISAGRSHSHNGSIDMMTFLNYSPTMEMFEDVEKGVYKKDPFNSVDPNPYGKRILNKEDSYSYNFNGNMDLMFKIIDGLTLSVQGGVNYSNSPSYTFNSSLVQPDAISGMANSNSTNVFWQNTNNVTYDKTFGDHHLTATAVFEVSGSEGRSLGITGTDLQNEFVSYWNVQNAKTRDATNGYSADALVSGLARVMYSYKGRYMVTGTFRADGSSKFQKGNRWGFFPSAALAWDIAKENFMKDQNIFQQLKLRGSFGIVGNQGIASYSTLGMLATTKYDGWGTDKVHTGYWTGNLATPNVTWESTYQYNVGLDASVLDGRLNFSFEWFRKDTKDLLLQKKAPNYNGGGTFWVNQGEIKNSGIEFTVSATPLGNKYPVGWETSFNASYVKNEIVDLAGDDFIVGDNNTGWGAGPIEIKKVGYPLGSFYLYKWKNFNSEGANLYERQSDGSLTTSPTADDLTVTGQAEPKWTFGWNNTLTYKNWALNIFINAAVGQDRLNMSRFGMASMVGKYRFISLADAYNKGWDKVENKADAMFASHKNPNNKNYGDSDFWLEDASFVKLKNISLSYTFPKKVTKIADIQLSVSAQNLFTLTKYTGMDPEVYSSDFYNGVDLGAYPVPRTFTFGMKLNF
ncbi:TonB-dependent receptor P3 [Bacteroides finegoldii]|uniref:SusC/RagA family TonB-linked outer membrane protein n=1 Tax=Bacteroides finegoldii CL09T03C10 TaxID=997888 RepID=K5BTR9_9BACE|nr:TonB-dependent receptor [Bacteroides finegoldii]EKJ91117.1 SusC/RagA family TonB-linked outer membrane protein [Bacteroides finegoldii CL09T03C10]